MSADVVGGPVRLGNETQLIGPHIGWREPDVGPMSPEIERNTSDLMSADVVGWRVRLGNEAGHIGPDIGFGVTDIGPDVTTAL